MDPPFNWWNHVCFHKVERKKATTWSWTDYDIVLPVTSAPLSDEAQVQDWVNASEPGDPDRDLIPRLENDPRENQGSWARVKTGEVVTPTSIWMTPTGGRPLDVLDNLLHLTINSPKVKRLKIGEWVAYFDKEGRCGEWGRAAIVKIATFGDGYKVVLHDIDTGVFHKDVRVDQLYELPKEVKVIRGKAILLKNPRLEPLSLETRDYGGLEVAESDKWPDSAVSCVRRILDEAVEVEATISKKATSRRRAAEGDLRITVADSTLTWLARSFRKLKIARVFELSSFLLDSNFALEASLTKDRVSCREPPKVRAKNCLLEYEVKVNPVIEPNVGDEDVSNPFYTTCRRRNFAEERERERQLVQKLETLALKRREIST